MTESKLIQLTEENARLKEENARLRAVLRPSALEVTLDAVPHDPNLLLSVTATLVSITEVRSEGGTPSHNLTLRDDTRTMPAKIWPDAMVDVKALRRGQKIKVLGRVEDLDGHFRLSIRRVEVVDEA